MEYAQYGNLHEFLKHCRPTRFPHYIQTSSSLSSCSSPGCSSHARPHLPLSAQVSDATTHTYLHFSSSGVSEVATPTNSFKLSTSSIGSFSHQISYLVPMAHHVCPLLHDYVNMPTKIGTGDFQNFAFQIASGLDHLNKMKVSSPSLSQPLYLSLSLSRSLNLTLNIDNVFL